MVSLIIHPNERIDRELFLDRVNYHYDKTNKPVNIRIIGVSFDKVPLKHSTCPFVRLYVEIRQYQFYCKAYSMENGVIDKRQTELVNASWETISMRFKLIRRGKHKINGESFYKFETDHILFNLINYGFIEKELYAKRQ